MEQSVKKYQVRLSRTAAKEWKKIPEPYRSRIGLALQKLVEAPQEGKALKGELAGLYSWRVWPYRIIYQIVDTLLLVEVLDIGHRQGVYR